MSCATQGTLPDQPSYPVRIGDYENSSGALSLPIELELVG